MVSRRSLLLFAALGVAWGIPYVLIKIAVAELAPEMLVLARTGLAALLLLPLAAARKELRPVLRHWKPLLAFTLVEVVVPWYFLNAAEQRLPSSTTGLLLAAVPLAGVGVAFLMRRSVRFTGGNWLGIVLGMAGVGAIVGLDLAGSDLVGVAQLAIVVVGYALGPAIIARWMPEVPGVGVIALSFAAAATVYVPVVLFTGAWPGAWPSLPVVVSVLILAVVCSAFAFILLFALIAEVGPVRTTTVTYINPAVAVIAGAVLLGEQITVWTVLGFVLVLAGSYLVTRRA